MSFGIRSWSYTKQYTTQIHMCFNKKSKYIRDVYLKHVNDYLDIKNELYGRSIKQDQWTWTHNYALS